MFGLWPVGAISIGFGREPTLCRLNNMYRWEYQPALLCTG